MAGLLLVLALTMAQSPSFDVASVKAVQLTGADTYRANLGTVLHGEVELTNATLSDCLKFAYGYSTDEQIEGPAWIKDKSVRFDIQAKSPPDTPRPQSLVMLQKLLTERFQLALHKEQKTRSYVALSIGKKGLKMLPAAADAPVNKSNNGLGHIISPHMSIPVLALLLSRFMRQPVIDQTGLDGFMTCIWNGRPRIRTLRTLHPAQRSTPRYPSSLD